jgi:sugar phosphate isomerase/epimerase
MTVAETMIEAFGGREELAAALGVNIVQVYRWTYPKDKKGTGGAIPARHFPKLLELAKKRGIEVDPADLIKALRS